MLPNWPEWKHKVFTFVNAHFRQNGKRVVEAMRWAGHQRKQLLEENLYSDERVLAWSSVFSDEDHSPTYFIKDASEVFSALYTLLTAFTEDQAHKLVRNAGDGEGLEAWRKLSQEFDPITNMRRQTILSLVQDPPRVEDVKCLGPALEDWLSKKVQYETFTDVKGNPCTVTDDSAIAALYKLMPQTLFNNLQMQVEEYDASDLPADGALAGMLGRSNFNDAQDGSPATERLSGNNI